MKTIKFGITLLLASFVAIASAAEETSFYGFQGESRSIESFMEKDRWLIVMIWAHDCHVCNQEAESYAQFHEEHKDKDAQVLGLSIDGLSKIKLAKGFIKEHDLPFPNLIDEPEKIMLYYQSKTGSAFVGTPTFMIFNPEGRLMAAEAGAVPTELIAKYISSN